MTITMQKSDYEKLLAHARAQIPEEACGLLGGTMDEEGNKRIEFVYLLENIDHSHEHFSLSPKDQLAAVKDMRAHGWKLLGNWHSHPESPSRPSDEDKRLAYDRKASYLILSLMEPEKPVLNAFHIEDGAAARENLEYV